MTGELTTGGSMSPEQRLRALEELEQRQQRNQRRVARAVWGSIVVGTVVLGAILVLATWQLTAVRREIVSLSDQRTGLQSDIAKLQKQKEEVERQRKQAQQQLIGATGALANVPEKQLKEAIDRQFETAPQTAALLPRIYVHFVDRADSERAQAIRNALQEAGYLVLGIQYVPEAQALRTSDVRFYHAPDRGEAEKIVQALNVAGEPNVNLNYLRQYENSTTARPNHFEVWLAHRAE